MPRSIERTPPRHWRRSLKSGIEFYFRSPCGQTMKGTASSEGTATHLQGLFEAATGCALPPAEIKPRRGAHRGR